MHVSAATNSGGLSTSFSSWHNKVARWSLVRTILLFASLTSLLLSTPYKHHYEQALSTLNEEPLKQNGNTRLLRDEVARDPPLLPPTEWRKATTTNNNNHKLPLCTREKIRQGSWVPKQYPQLPYLPKQIDAKMCYTKDDFARPWNTHEWMPHDAAAKKCEYTQWDPALFCAVAYQQTIAFIGDSLTLEHFSGLIHMLGIYDFEEEITYHNDGPNTFSYNVCPHNTTRIIMHRDNYLKSYKKIMKGSDVVVMNKGAWYQDHAVMQNKIANYLIPYFQTWQTECESKRRPRGSLCQVLWRTSVPGHPQCSNFTQPATSVKEMEAWIANNKGKHHWHEFKHQNKMVEATFYNHSTKIDYLDAYDAMILRPDARVARNGKKDDCLHNCQPGPTLAYNPWLLHLMRIQEERIKQANQEDVTMSLT